MLRRHIVLFIDIRPSDGNVKLSGPLVAIYPHRAEPEALKY